MYLKSIEVQGFKSFANKTVFEFHNGITGIVGPNGSGKSNVADAVRWVLGEQRVKQLRGGSMQDVIFAGTQLRKPLGYASVAITLDNADHMLPVPYDEVTVSRRLYRSGESEYLINGASVRLKDINEIFYDTGIGKEGYSIIGQGQIDKILSGKPEERRELFDEAAGIVKFKRRKLETERKLEHEQANLQRVNDILSELGRQIGPLQRQSEKAKIYLKKRDELKIYDVNLFLTDYTQLQQREQAAEENLRISEGELEEVRHNIEEIRNRYESASASLDEILLRQKTLTEELTGKRLEKADLEKEADILREQQRAMEEQLLVSAARLGDIDKEKSDREDRIGQAREALQMLGDHLIKDRETDARLQQEHQRLLSGISALNDRISENHAKALSLVSDRSTIAARAQHFDTMLEQIGIRKSELAGKILELKTEENARKEELAAAREESAAISARIEELTGKSDAASARLETVSRALSEANASLEEKQLLYHKESSRLETLRGIAERYDGYGNSIRKVMERKSAEKGLCGVVADLIQTRKEYETAIETALGGSIQNIVTEDEDTAKRMIEYLKINKFGRATFLPLSAMKRSDSFKQTGALNEPGAVALASTLVQTDARYAALVSFLLGRTLVVDNIDHAIAIARKYKYVLRIVTLEGEQLNPGGSMTGGAFKNSSNLLGRRREIEELSASVKETNRQLQELRKTIDDTRDERNALRDQIRELGAQLQDEYLLKNSSDMKAAQLAAEMRGVKASYDEIMLQTDEAAVQIEDLNRDKEEVSEKLSASEEEELKLHREEEYLHKELSRLGSSEKEKSEEIGNLHVQISALEQKEGFMRQELQRFEEESRALDAEKETILQSRSRSDEERIARDARIASLLEMIGEKESQAVSLQQEIDKTQERKDRLSKEQKSFFEEREALSSRESLLDKETYRLTSQIERTRENLNSRISYMWDEYELTYNTALPLRRDDLGSPANWKKAMNALKNEIRELGSVNVSAIEEYKEVSERYSFLQNQHDDLVQAEASLRKIIAQLESGMRKQFREQFALITQAFDTSFQELFGGGKGTLELTEEEDILDAGVRIIAQPPGKKLQNMMQLSGGEKALTAIALLFAIQNLKPSPFCLLDEIEAALDESNVDRYASYLHKLTKQTQFIIITHRRGTMTAADRLYGVTMQEKGVSALVSVDLIESELDK